MKAALARIAGWAMEKAYGPGTWLSGANGYRFDQVPANYPMHWWQCDLPTGLGDTEPFGPVVTAVSTIAQDLSKIDVMHHRALPDGSFEVVTNKAPMRVLRRPNQYQTRNDFMHYLAVSLLSDGNAYAVAGRNDRYEISTLHPMNPGVVRPMLGYDGEVFYHFARSAWTDTLPFDIDDGFYIPARDVLHIRGATPRHPLLGESPLVAALYPVMVGQQINKHNANFFRNLSRPSGILRHPGSLSPEAMTRIKDRWRDITTSGNIGDVPVLQEGMDWKPLNMTAVDAELARSFQLAERQIFQLFRIPSYMYGDAQSQSSESPESMLRFYVQTCLTYYLSAFESAFGAFFDLPNNERIDFDVEGVMLKGNLRERMEAYGKGVQNAIMTPNEARHNMGLSPMEYGGDLRAQQQLVPLSYGAQLTPPGSDELPPEDEERRISEIMTKMLAT